MSDHKLTLEAQPIADQWKASCSCGWVSTASMHVHSAADAALAQLSIEHDEHIKEQQLEDWRSEMIHWGI